MKKTVFFLATMIAITSCSSSDDDKNVDTIVSQVYTPLSSIDNLAAGTYKYVGNDVGNGKVGLVNPSSSNCKEKDYLIVYKSGQKLDSITYANYNSVISKDKEIVCQKLGVEYDRVFRNNRLNAAGMLTTLVTEDEKIPLNTEEKKLTPEKEFKVITNTIFKGTLEIGEQAGYLRIEDKISNYKPGSQIKGKPYLYFKKM